MHYAVELTRHFAALDALPPAGGNRTFLLNPPPWPSFSYGAATGWALFVVTVLLTLRWFSRKRFHAMRPATELVRAGIALVITLLVVCGVITSVQNALRGGVPYAHPHFWSLFYQYPQAMIGYGLIALGLGTALLGAFARGLGRAWQIGVPVGMAAVLYFGDQLGAITLGGLIVGAALLLWFRRGVALPHLAAAGALVWLALAIAAQLTVATASFMVVLPLLWVAALGALLPAGPMRDALAVVVPLLLWASVLYGLYLMLGVRSPLVPAVAASLLMLLVAGALARIGAIGRGGLAALMLVAGVAVTIRIGVTTPFSERYQQPTELFLDVDADTGAAAWRSSDPVLNDWLRTVLGDEPQRRPLDAIPPEADTDTWVAPVDVEVAAPGITITEDRRDGERRRIRLSVDTAMDGERVDLYFAPDVAIEHGAIDGQPITVPDEFRQARQDAWWRWSVFGDTREPLTVDLALATDSPLRGRLVEVAYRWPEGMAPPPRPGNLMRRPYALSDATVIHRGFGDGTDVPGPDDR